MQDLKLVIGNKNTSSWSLRPWLLLKHLELPFEEVRVALRRPDTGRQIRAWAPSGKVPALRAGEITIWDTLAIAEFLAERHPELWPEAVAARAVARSVSAEMHSGFAELRRFMPMDFTARFDPPGRLLRGVEADVARVCEVWADCRERFGQGGPFLFGRLSIADAMFAPVCSRFVTYAVPIDETCAEYVEAVMALPAMEEWGQAAAIEVERGVEAWVPPRAAPPPRPSARIEPFNGTREPAHAAPMAPAAAWRQSAPTPRPADHATAPAAPPAFVEAPPRRPVEEPARQPPPPAPAAEVPPIRRADDAAAPPRPPSPLPPPPPPPEAEPVTAEAEPSPSPQPSRADEPAPAGAQPLGQVSSDTLMAALVRHVGQERRERQAQGAAADPARAPTAEAQPERPAAAPPSEPPPAPSREEDGRSAAPALPEPPTPPDRPQVEWAALPQEPPPWDDEPVEEPRSLPSFRVRRFGLFSSRPPEPPNDEALPPAPLARPTAASPGPPPPREEAVDRPQAAAEPVERPPPPTPPPAPPPTPPPSEMDRPPERAPARPFNIGMIKPIGDGIRRRR